MGGEMGAMGGWVEVPRSLDGGVIAFNGLPQLVQNA